MKTYLYPLLAGLLSLAACTNDTLQEIAPVAPGENNSTTNAGKGTFFMDYSVDGGASTRAGGSPLKVQTLDYYVYYAEGGELVKHRRIRINTNQSFPLTRENMTWEQRQALQDTLQYDVKYRTLFIANVDSTLFNYGTYSSTNPHPAVVTGDTLYQNARILLPNVPFHEDNYYCLWEDTLHQLSTVPLNGPMKRDDVLLQRIVTRTDIRRVDTPTTLYDAIEEGFYKENCESNVKETVKWWIDEFCKNIQECEENSSIGGWHPQNKLDNYETEVNSMVTILTNNKELIYEAYKKQLITEYETTIQSSSKYKDRMQLWTDTGENAQVKYDEVSPRANSMGFDKQTEHDSERANEALCTITNGTVRIIGYSGGESLNTVSSINFNEATTPFTIEGKSFNTQQGINSWYNIICDPVETIRFTGSNADDHNSINLLTILEGVQEWDALMNNTEFINTLNDEYFNCWWHAEDFDGRSLSDFPVNTNLPNITAENVDSCIELIPSWSEPEKVVNE